MLKGHVQCSEWEVNEFRKDTSPSAVSRGMCRACVEGRRLLLGVCVVRNVAFCNLFWSFNVYSFFTKFYVW